MGQPGDRWPAPIELMLLQDFANSVDIEARRETLRSPADLSEFCGVHGLGRQRFDDQDVVEAIRLREALRAACLAHTGIDVPPGSQGVLNYELSRAPLRLTITPDGQAKAEPQRNLDGIPLLTAHIATGVLTAVATGSWPRLKACSADTCRWVYYDRSPGGRSRWCTMSICGSRAKMRAYRSTRASKAT